jgi:hypothetical protein
MRKPLFALLAVASLPAALLAAEFWKQKPVREWTREETQSFLNDSPWMHRVVVEGSLLDLSGPMGSVETEPGRGESSGAEDGASRTMVNVDRGPRGGPPYYIEWSSAKIVREAGQRLGVLLGRTVGESEPPPLTGYLLTIGGPDLKAFNRLSEAELKSAACLRPRHAKSSIAPEEVGIRKLQDGRILSVQFRFPRQISGRPAISDQETSVDFACKIKGLALKVRFDLNKMVIGQERDL